MVRRALWLAPVLTLVVGCGDGDSSTDDWKYPYGASDREQIRALLDRYHAAVAQEDSAVMCEDVVRFRTAKPQPTTAECVEVLNGVFAREEFHDGDDQVEHIKLDRKPGFGKSAVVIYADGHRTDNVFREAGRWWIQLFD